MLQVSTADIIVIWKFEKNRDKIPLFALEREVNFLFSYRGFREFESLILIEICYKLYFQNQW